MIQITTDSGDGAVVVITKSKGQSQTISLGTRKVVVEDIGDESCEIWSIETIDGRDAIHSLTVSESRPSAHYYPDDNVKITAEYFESQQ